MRQHTIRSDLNDIPIDRRWVRVSTGSSQGWQVWWKKRPHSRTIVKHVGTVFSEHLLELFQDVWKSGKVATTRLGGCHNSCNSKERWLKDVWQLERYQPVRCCGLGLCTDCEAEVDKTAKLKMYCLNRRVVSEKDVIAWIWYSVPDN